MVLTPHDREAFAKIYTTFHTPFSRYCASKCLGNDELADVMQEAIALGLERWPAIRDESQLLPYLIGIVKHRYRNRLRSRTVVDRFLATREGSVAATSAPRADLALELDETLRAIDRLPEKLQEALLLHTLSGFSIREVAELQGASETAIKTRIHRARTRLRALLEEKPSTIPTVHSVAARLSTLTAILF